MVDAKRIAVPRIHHIMSWPPSRCSWTAIPGRQPQGSRGNLREAARWASDEVMKKRAYEEMGEITYDSPGRALDEYLRELNGAHFHDVASRRGPTIAVT